MKASLLRRGVLVSAICMIFALVHADAWASKEERAPAPLAKRAASLEKDAMALAATDRRGVAPKALEQAKKWAKQALAAAKKGELEKGERAQLRARLQIELARELISLAKLERRIAALKQELATVRSRVKTRKTKLGERDEYLNLLKVTRQ